MHGRGGSTRRIPEKFMKQQDLEKWGLKHFAGENKPGELPGVSGLRSASRCQDREVKLTRKALGQQTEANNPASDFHDHGQYSVKKKRNTSSPTFERAHEARAEQHAALSGQAAATAMQHVHLDELSVNTAIHIPL